MKNHVKSFHSFSINEENINDTYDVAGTMPPGKYWIGDLCYVMDDKWGAVCDLIIQGNDVGSGVFELPDGTTFVSLNTAYGDGVYTDLSRNQYPVDAGLIGAIKVDDITSKNVDMRGGHVFDFPYEWAFRKDDGILSFDSIIINTGDKEDYDDDYYPEDEDPYRDDEDEDE
jgi:hypothetical protein